MNEQSVLLRAREVAQTLALSKSEVYEMMSDGRLPVVRFGKAVRVLREDVERIISENRTAALEAAGVEIER